MGGEAEQVAPDPPPPDIVQLVPPVYPAPPLLMVMLETAVPVLVAVQVACVPPPQRVPPAGERYEFRLLGAPRVQVGVLV
jgi:hypothetical protein